MQVQNPLVERALLAAQYSSRLLALDGGQMTRASSRRSPAPARYHAHQRPEIP
jgi:hypothetical protein